MKIEVDRQRLISEIEDLASISDAEPPAVTIGVVQPILLQNGHKKILSEVLRILN